MIFCVAEIQIRKVIKNVVYRVKSVVLKKNQQAENDQVSAARKARNTHRTGALMLVYFSEKFVIHNAYNEKFWAEGP